MCGIAGVLGSGVEPASLMHRMLGEVQHRGPDDSGTWSVELDSRRVLSLGHRRLSIIDLSDAAAQPMEDSSGRFVLVHNGEIYNYLEIRSELIGLGVRFRSRSDTEVILEAYKQWGSECLSRFNGMFAFALYDSMQGVLFCARDRYGEKPFLFHLSSDFFAFASEYKSLLQHPGIPFEIDEVRAISSAVVSGTGLDSDRETVFLGVQQLLPAEAMIVDIRNLEHKIWRYWEIQPADSLSVRNENQIFDEFRELLVDSVRLRLRSDVPVGSCLSGGLDSSAIVCIARQILGDDADYHTFTGRFPDTVADEWEYARQVVDTTNVVSHIVAPTVDQFMCDLPRFLWHNELPVGGSSQFAQWCVFRLAKDHGVTVLLDGQGGDENLGGYENYFRYYITALQEQGETERLDRELPLLKQRYPGLFAPPLRVWRDRVSFEIRHRLARNLGVGTSLLYGLQPELAKSLSENTRLRQLSGFNALSSALAQNSFGRFLTTLLRYGDRNSMAHSREVRLPFCDHRIAEFVQKLPPHILMGEIQTKRLLRESMRNILPESIRTRWQKQGFVPPQHQWFESKKFMAIVKDTFNEVDFQKSLYWYAPWWHSALDRFKKGETGLNRAIWRAFIHERWRRDFVTVVEESRTNAKRELRSLA